MPRQVRLSGSSRPSEWSCGGLSLAAAYLVRPLAAWFILQLVAGVYVIHGRAGWFVVGAGQNGAEFSALPILCFVVITMSPRRTRPGPRSLTVPRRGR